MSVILLNLVTGPPLFRAAIIAAGEARALQLPSLASDVFEAAPSLRASSVPKTASKCAAKSQHLDLHQTLHLCNATHAPGCIRDSLPYNINTS